MSRPASNQNIIMWFKITFTILIAFMAGSVLWVCFFCDDVEFATDGIERPGYDKTWTEK